MDKIYRRRYSNDRFKTKKWTNRGIVLSSKTNGWACTRIKYLLRDKSVFLNYFRVRLKLVSLIIVEQE